jgi:TonB family protein
VTLHPPPLRLSLAARPLAPGAVLALLVHAGVVALLIASGRALRASGGTARPASAGLNFFVLPAGTPGAVDIALAPRVQLADLPTLRRIAAQLPPLEVPRPQLPPPTVVELRDPAAAAGAVEPRSATAGPVGAAGGTGGTGGAGDGGPGTGDAGGYIFRASPRELLQPPRHAPGAMAGRWVRVRFWVAADGRVTRVEVDPSIPDAAYGREFQQRMMAYLFYPAHTRDGRPIADVVTISVRFGN